MAFDGRSDDRKHCRLNTNLFDTNVVGIENIMVKPLSVQPLTDRTRLERRDSGR
jgi:hypothetical protein